VKLQKPENDNYAAVVTRISTIVPLENCDNVVGTPLFGFQAIVGKDTLVGELGIVFPAETQISEEYARQNNLHRHGDLNDDQGAKGYLEDNRRVKAMKFRGHRSDCLFMPLTSLAYIKKLDLSEFKEGDVFDAIGDHEICKKYQIKRTNREARLEKNKTKFVRVDKKFMPEHYDSDNYFRNVDVIPDDRTVIVTQKLHGTSIRVGNTIVARKLKLRDRAARALGVRVADTEHDYVFGSRKVIKDVNNPNQEHFYSTDLWSEEGKKLEGVLPNGYLLYGELIGWAPNGGPIQKNYTYKVPHGTCDLYVYRVATVNNDGFVCDLSWDQTVEFCKDRGLKTVPELWRGAMRELPEELVRQRFTDVKFRETGYPQAVDLDPESPCDEGVCIRLDGIAPYILKAKSPVFYEHESKMLDEEAVDLEAEGSET
jgi:hypothetical protein